MEISPLVLALIVIASVGIGAVLIWLLSPRQPESTSVEQLEPLFQQLKKELTETSYQQSRGQFDQLTEQVQQMTNALQHPTSQGQWGEAKLKELVEMAGLSRHVDYHEQDRQSQGTPDMTISLPNGGKLPVDAKNVMTHYFKAVNSEDKDQRESHLSDHVKALRSEIQRLSKKAYWDQFKKSPKCVVMFVPVESSLTAACQKDKDLFQYALNNKVLICTPTTLLAMLNSVTFAWSQQEVAENAEKIQELGQALFDSLQVFARHISTLRTRLDKTVEGYNKLIGSLDNNVMVSARKMHELGLSGKQEDMPDPVERDVRQSRYEDESNLVDGAQEEYKPF